MKHFLVCDLQHTWRYVDVRVVELRSINYVLIFKSLQHRSEASGRMTGAYIRFNLWLVSRYGAHVFFLENISAFSMKMWNHWYAYSKVLIFPVMTKEVQYRPTCILRMCQPKRNIVTYVGITFFFFLLSQNFLCLCKIWMLALYTHEKWLRCHLKRRYWLYCRHNKGFIN